jgi:cytochrome c oxidase cbb3-type subunit 3
MSEGKRTDEIQGEILHVYDGIEEADNNLPTWWLLTFYGAVAFGLVYWFYYHEYGIGKLQPQQYAEAVAAAEAERSIVTDESLDAMALDGTSVASGKEIFMAQCYACHDQGQGRVGLGSNLTDKYWVHGGAPTDIHKIVSVGIAEKGMPPWAPILGETGVNQVVAYVLTMRNTNLEGGKPVEEYAVEWDPDAELVEDVADPKDAP